MDDISFLSSLSKATDLEITHFPKNVDFALLYVLSLTNLHSITFNLDPAAASISETFYHDYQPYLDVEELSTIVCQQKPKLGCPTILRLPGDQKIDPQLRTILGDSLTITTTPSEQGFLDVTRNVRFRSDDDESIGGHSYDEDPDYNSDSLEFIEYRREDDDYEYSDSDLYNHYDDGEYADDYTTDGLGWD
ncbi:hypothetical protein BDZ97DRAFT_1786268 [Flammula alnicola]|nr:hypothetical protein BDZ97DRAFT_1786268 [Flammula alnicola]